MPTYSMAGLLLAALTAFIPCGDLCYQARSTSRFISSIRLAIRFGCATWFDLPCVALLTLAFAFARDKALSRRPGSPIPTTAPTSDRAAETPIAGANPALNRLGGAEASGPGEHHDEDRDPEYPAKKAQHVEDAGCLADLDRGDRAQDGVLGGRHGHRNAGTGDDQR